MACPCSRVGRLSAAFFPNTSSASSARQQMQKRSTNRHDRSQVSALCLHLLIVFDTMGRAVAMDIECSRIEYKDPGNLHTAFEGSLTTSHPAKFWLPCLHLGQRRAAESTLAFGSAGVDELLIQRSLHRRTCGCLGQRCSTSCCIASDQERFQTVARARSDHHCDGVITHKAAPPWLAAAILLQQPSTQYASLIELSTVLICSHLATSQHDLCSVSAPMCVTGMQLQGVDDDARNE